MVLRIDKTFVSNFLRKIEKDLIVLNIICHI